MTERNWVRWHDPYDDPESSLHRRLLLVQQRIREFLDAAPAGPLRVLSMCAGQGRDLLGVLPTHPRAADVRAVLVELDPDNAARARETARSAGLDGITVLTADAGTTTVYRDIVPVHLALVCGVFGNISDADIHHTITQLPTLCAPGATVIWTRHREPPDLTPTIRTWFTDAGFTELTFTPLENRISVATHRLTTPTTKPPASSPSSATDSTRHATENAAASRARHANDLHNPQYQCRHGSVGAAAAAPPLGWEHSWKPHTRSGRRPPSSRPRRRGSSAC